MRLALASVIAVVAAGCHDASEPALAPEAALPLAGHVVAPEQAPPVTELVYVAANGSIRKAEVAAPWDAPRAPTAVAEPASPRRLALDAAGLLDPPKLQRGELAGAQAMVLAGLSHAPLVLAAPRAPAVAITRLVATRGGMLAVSVGGRTGVLAIGFGPVHDVRTSAAGGWAELFGEATALVLIDARTGSSRTVRLDGGMVDSEALRAALAELPPTYMLDLVVGEDFTAQQLVDAIGVIYSAGWTDFQLVISRRTSEQRRAELVEASRPRVAIGQPNAQGDLDKAAIRKTINTVTDQILRCYTSVLDAMPTLGGTVMIQFVIMGDGTVKTAGGSGVSPAVASCVAAVIQRLTFPHPRGGGVVQVNYPFTFRNGY